MKRLLSIILILALTLTFFGCARRQEDDEAVIDITEKQPESGQVEVIKPTEQSAPQKEPVKEQKQPEKEQTPPQTEQKEEPVQDTPAPTPTQPKPATVPDYASFDCRKNKKWKQVRFTNEAGVTLHFEIPDDWVISKSANGYNISRDEIIIGTLSQNKPDGPTAFFDFEMVYDEKYEIFKSYQVNWYHTDGGDTVARVFELSTDQGRKNIQMYLSVNYTELDGDAREYLLNSALTVPKAEEDEVFPALADTNGSKKILLLGNSFINSSRVNTFLNDMLRDTGYTLVTVARGNAQVYTFSNDSTICEQIRNGEYAYVFVGCFYTDDSIPAVKVLLDCANESNTKLVAFPAHNEGNGVFEKAVDTYDGLMLLNWRGEINSLIESGVDKWVLCVDDIYQHSTVYAGYVGAHMVYRKVFNKVPPKLSGSAPLTQSQVDGILIGYADSMHTPEPPEEIAFNGVEYKI